MGRLAAPRPPTYTLNGVAFPKVQPKASRLSTYSTSDGDVPVLFTIIRRFDGRPIRANARSHPGLPKRPEFSSKSLTCRRPHFVAECCIWETAFGDGIL